MIYGIVNKIAEKLVGYMSREECYSYMTCESVTGDAIVHAAPEERVFYYLDGRKCDFMNNDQQ